ncbi:MAG TPA: hypothetical protein GX498_01135 [Clostridiales bacterium]|nr:hypothetical protein [Clostridiales bacterium]
MFEYWGDILGKGKITTDSDSITPGMIYVDINTKSRKNIYKAHRNGASIIVTDKNLSNPNIPVIKVKDIEEAYFTLLNMLYERPIDMVSLIAVHGGIKGDFIVKLLNGVFIKHFTKSLDSIKLDEFTYAFFTEKSKSIAEKLFYYILLCISNEIKVIPLNYSSDYARFNKLLKRRYDCRILIDENGERENNELETIEGQTLFVNIDNPNILKRIDEQKDNIVITFGLNKKAAVTATSIEYGEITKFNYCLQRAFHTKSGNIVEPFEVPIAINGLGINNVYSALAAISCALYYDIDLECIKDVLSKCEDRGRDFSITRFKDFILINSYCITEKDCREAFEKMQMLDYGNLHVIISALYFDIDNIEKLLFELINEWGVSLNIKEIIVLLKNEKMSSKSNMELLENGISIKYYEQLPNVVCNVINNITDRDVVLILGQDEICSAQYIFELMLSNKY